MTDSGVISERSVERIKGQDLDPRGWALWLLAGALLTMATRNPLYLILLVAVSRAVDAVCGQRSNSGWSMPFWRFSAAILLFSVVFNMLMAHVGATVLINLPESWWLVGGSITLEAGIFGLVSGLSLVALLSFFLTFTHAVPPHRMVQLIPRALHDLGLVTLIAMTFIPQTIQQQQRIREAQAIRGYRSQGLRSWRPLVIPLLVGGMERSLNLAETMMSRGFGATESQEQPGGARLLLIIALALALGGALWLAWGGLGGWGIIGIGVATLIGSYWLIGRRIRHTRYRAQSWSRRDSVVVLSALLPLVLLVMPTGIIDRSSLIYAPYSGSLAPQFSVLVGLLMLLLTAPALLELT